jgi:tRNA A-37 threonylcarbamoyl transferase component Bud32
VGGRYTLRAAIGHGGMGTVWRASDTQLGRDVAVKEVVPPPAIAPEDLDAMYERMLREARAAAVLSHPGVVQVYDVVTEDERPWIIMELLDARSLSEIVLADGPLAPRAVAKIGVTLLGALEVAHAAGVLHRDVKPANVLVCTDGRCVLTDFGVARMPTDQQLTTPGMVLGSPHFISPERALGASFGPPSDLFSLGVTLYCAVEGRPPFDKGEPIATMHAVVEDDPLPPQRAGVLTEVLYGLLEKDPNRRWEAPTCREVLRELLAGPLASRTPQFPTDPYSVVPAQRLPWQPPVGSETTSQIGGRALLGAGQTPTDALADRTDAYAAQHSQAPDPYHDTAATPMLPPSPVDHGLFRRVARRVARELHDQPRRAVTVGAAGLAAMLVLIATVWVFAAGRDDSPGASAAGGPAPGGAPEAADDQPLIPVQVFADRGIIVNLPEGWSQVESTPIRVDFADPEDPVARIRLLVENSGADARQFIENVAEPNISGNCLDPYQRVEITDIEVDGQAAAQLEYTCGEGESTQRTRWVTMVRDGTAYSFFLRVSASQFDERRVIFEELVRSFRLADA